MEADRLGPIGESGLGDTFGTIQECWRKNHILPQNAADWLIDKVERLTVELARLRGNHARLLTALEAIARRVPIMASTGDYRDGQLHALQACREVACAAITAADAEQEATRGQQD